MTHREIKKQVTYSRKILERKMGMSMPLVGYVAARQHNDEREKPTWNRKRLAEVDMFMGAMRIAYLQGWAKGLIPVGEAEAYKRKGLLIHEKNLEHRIFYESDLINRPKMKEMIDFIMHEPYGGTICVVDKADLFDAETGQYTIIQCKTAQILHDIPIIECGFVNDIGSVNSRLAHGYGDKDVIQKILVNALNLREAHTRRLGAQAFKERLCEMRKADLSDDKKYHAMSEADKSDLLCPDCVEKLTRHQNARKAPLERDLATRTRVVG